MKRKPTNLKKLTGNPGKRPLNENEPQPKGVPECPNHLNEPAKTEWKRIVPELEACGLLSNIDRAALSAYCEAWGEFVQISNQLKGKTYLVETTNGNLIQNPLLGQKHKAMELIHKFLTEFGMTPVARSRISVNPPKAKDPLEELLKDVNV